MSQAEARAAGLKAWTETAEEKAATRKWGAGLFDTISTFLGLTTPFLPPPVNLAAGTTSVGFKLMSWGLEPPTPGGVLYDIAGLALPAVGAPLRYARAEFEFTFTLLHEIYKPTLVPRIDAYRTNCPIPRKCS